MDHRQEGLLLDEENALSFAPSSGATLKICTKQKTYLRILLDLENKTGNIGNF